MGSSPAEVAEAVVEAAVEVAAELGVSEQEAAAAVRTGILRAATDAGEETLAAVGGAVHGDSDEGDAGGIRQE